MAEAHAYVVEELDDDEYTCDELSDYLSQMAQLQKLRLVSVYNTNSGKLRIVWEVE